MENDPQPFSHEDVANLWQRKSSERHDATAQKRAQIYRNNLFLSDYMNVADDPLEKWQENVLFHTAILKGEIAGILDNEHWVSQTIDPLARLLTAQGGFFVPGISEETAQQVVLDMVGIGYVQGGEFLSYYHNPPDDFMVVLPDIEELLQTADVIGSSEQHKTRNYKTLISLLNEGIQIHQKAAQIRANELLIDLKDELPPKEKQSRERPTIQDIPQEMREIIMQLFHIHPDDPQANLLTNAFPEGIPGADTLRPTRRGRVPDWFQHAFAEGGIPGINTLPPPPSDNQTNR